MLFFGSTDTSPFYLNKWKLPHFMSRLSRLFILRWKNSLREAKLAFRWSDKLKPVRFPGRVQTFPSVPCISTFTRNTRHPERLEPVRKRSWIRAQVGKQQEAVIKCETPSVNFCFNSAFLWNLNFTTMSWPLRFYRFILRWIPKFAEQTGNCTLMPL